MKCSKAGRWQDRALETEHKLRAWGQLFAGYRVGSAHRVEELKEQLRGAKETIATQDAEIKRLKQLWWDK